ncbi:hypothetical protein ACQPZG_16625 [Streptomyces sp. CA-294286]|uniref:hypothetical protein n=1 Tax=Streptomyces sp. CA-294286 TaxID=3240070 RepID=UPI003D8A1503
MPDTTDPRNNAGQSNTGPGVFIAGNVYGDVSNQQIPYSHYRRAEEARVPPGQQRNEKASPEEDQSDEDEGPPGPGQIFIGWCFATYMAFGMAGMVSMRVFAPQQSTWGRVGMAFLAVGIAAGGVTVLALLCAALAELCASGTANAADSARRRGAQGQRAAARLNLRYAALAGSVARTSAVLTGFIAGLFGFLAIGKNAADRAHDACEAAEAEIAKAREELGESLGGR